MPPREDREQSSSPAVARAISAPKPEERAALPQCRSKVLIGTPTVADCVAGPQVKISRTVSATLAGVPPPTEPVIFKVVGPPAGVLAEVCMVSVITQSFVQVPGEKEADAPAGKPDAENVTGCAAPAVWANDSVVFPDAPFATSISPPVLVSVYAKAVFAVADD